MAVEGPNKAVAGNKFKVDFGGNETPQFYRVELPSMDIPVLEHEVGSKQNYPLKHADQPNYGGTFTAELYAQGSKSNVDKWWDNLKTYKENQSQKSISVTLVDPNDKSVLRWEFEDATLIKYEYSGQLSGGDAMKITITVSYQRMVRKLP
jgi:phage tail-like protein